MNDNGEQQIAPLLRGMTTKRQTAGSSTAALAQYARSFAQDDTVLGKLISDDGYDVLRPPVESAPCSRRGTWDSDCGAYSAYFASS